MRDAKGRFVKGLPSWNKGTKGVMKSWCKGTKGIVKPNSGSFKKGQNLGSNHPMWKGGKHKGNDGYVHIYQPNHPFANKIYVLEHRLVAERCLKRYLKPGEIIHHINDNPSDNRPKNLYYFSNRNKHQLFHRRVNKGTAKLTDFKSNIV